MKKLGAECDASTKHGKEDRAAFDAEMKSQVGYKLGKPCFFSAGSRFASHCGSEDGSLCSACQPTSSMHRSNVETSQLSSRYVTKERIPESMSSPQFVVYVAFLCTCTQHVHTCLCLGLPLGRTSRSNYCGQTTACTCVLYAPACT